MTDVLFSAAVFVVYCPTVMDSQEEAFREGQDLGGKTESSLQVVPSRVGILGYSSEQGSWAQHPSNCKVK